MSSVLRRQLQGLVLLVILVAVVAGVVLGYAQAFTPIVSVTVRADRSGLLMDPGSAVSLRGINVGKVREVRPDPTDGRHAVLQVALDPSQVAHIPANVTAQVVAATLFGAKYVQLDTPPVAAAQRIEQGAMIPTTAVSTESQDLLSNLNTLLTSVDVAKLNSGLGALSTSLQGRGDRLGRLLVQLNQYLGQVNPSLPALNRDFAAAADVANTYADITPDLVRILDNVVVTSDTLTDEKEVIPHLLSSLITVSDDGRRLLDRNGDGLEDFLSTLRPTSELLGDYSPLFPCVFASLNQLRGDMDKSVGYQYPGIHTFSTFLPGEQGYLYPRDLPKVGVHVRPTCYGGPLRPVDAPFPHVIFDDGWKGFVRSDAVTLTPGSPLPNPLPVPRIGPPPSASPSRSAPSSLDGDSGSGSPPGPSESLPDQLLGGTTGPAQGGGTN